MNLAIRRAFSIRWFYPQQFAPPVTLLHTHRVRSRLLHTHLSAAHTHTRHTPMGRKEPTKRTIAKDKATAKDKPTRSSEPSATTTSTAQVDGRIVYVSITMTPFCKKGETEYSDDVTIVCRACSPSFSTRTRASRFGVRMASFAFS